MKLFTPTLRQIQSRSNGQSQMQSNLPLLRTTIATQRLGETVQRTGQPKTTAGLLERLGELLPGISAAPLQRRLGVRQPSDPLFPSTRIGAA